VTSLGYALIAVFLLPRREAAVVSDVGAPQSGTQDAETSAPAPVGYRSMLRDRRFCAYLFMIFANAVIYIQMMAVLPLSIRRDGHPTIVYSSLFSLPAGMITAFELLITKAVQTRQPRGAVALGFVLLGAGLTALVRLCLHPLNRSQAKAQAASQKAREALAPAVAKLQRKYQADPARLQRETFDLYRKNGVSLSAGILPALAQIPVLMVMYRLFVSKNIGSQHNTLLTDQLFGVGLGSHLGDALAGPTAGIAHVAVFALLLAAIAAVATWAFLRVKATTATTATTTPQPTGNTARLLRFLPYGTVLTAAVVPLATGLYLATTTLWTVIERRHLANRLSAESD
jgi:YidC/Oxa1 family membrane protein insertase